MALDSPNILNYTVGKGRVQVRISGDTNFRDIGNCPEFEFTPVIEKLEHFSSQEGVKSKDRTVVLSKAGTLRIVMEELTAENMRIALLGAISEQSGGDQEIEIFGESSIRAEVKFIGTNDIGPKYEYFFRQVDFIPSSSINLISDEWLGVEITGDVAAVSGSFGTATKIADGV